MTNQQNMSMYHREKLKKRLKKTQRMQRKMDKNPHNIPQNTQESFYDKLKAVAGKEEFAGMLKTEEGKEFVDSIPKLIQDAVTQSSNMFVMIDSLEALVKENRAIVDPEFYNLVKSFDKAATRFAEDAEVYFAIQEQKLKDNVPVSLTEVDTDIAFSLLESINEMFLNIAPALMVHTTPHNAKLDEYIEDHVLENEDLIGYITRVVNKRMDENMIKYKTTLTMSSEAALAELS